VRARDRIATTAIGATLGLAIFAVGGAPRWSVVLIAFAVAVAVASQLTSRRRAAQPEPLLWFLGAPVMLTALQLVPLPPGVLAALNPTGHELVVDGLALAGHRGGWLPLSLDPPNTRRELLESVLGFGLGWVGLRLASSDDGRVRILSAVAGACGLAALIGLLHVLLGLEALYGLYVPQQANPRFMAPLLNPNHYACLLSVGAVLAAGLSLHHRLPRDRVLWIVVLLGCVAVALFTQSRGGVAALVAALTVFGVIIALQKMKARTEQRRPELWRVTVPAVTVILCTLIVVTYFSAGGVRRQLDETTLDELEAPRSKFVAWRSALELLNESPWVGVGRGGFEPAFPRVHAASAHHTFSHLENEYLQAAVDWGLPGAMIIAGLLGWLVFVAVRRSDDGPIAAACLAACAAVATQSVVDFGVELPGVAVPIILVLACLTRSPLRETSRYRKWFAPWAAVVAVTVGLAIWVATPAGRSLAEDRERMVRGAEPTWPEVRELMIRHPLDYLAPVYGARALRDQPRQAMALLNRALTLHPTHSDLHRLAARLLARNGKLGQARLEYSLVLRNTMEPELHIEELVALFPAPGDVALALPADHPAWHRIVRALTGYQRSDLALLYLERVVEASPSNIDAWQRLQAIAEERGDKAMAEKAARRRLELSPGVLAATALGRVLVSEGNIDEAERVLRPFVKENLTTADQNDARLVLCDVMIARKQWLPALACLERVRDTTAGRAETRRATHARMAAVAEAMGNARRAELERKQAEEP
jgi:tetratricopeptide (TPR) repeat protein